MLACLFIPMAIDTVSVNSEALVRRRPRSQFSKWINSVYNKKQRKFLGRDSLGWLKLATFYFFFYFALGIFFCIMVTVLMKMTPKTRPRYYGESSSMNGGSSIFSPGLGYRPNGDVQSNLIYVNKSIEQITINRHALLLEYYLNASTKDSLFSINDPGHCRTESQYGFSMGQPCVLVKMNKVFDFQPRPGYQQNQKEDFEATGCTVKDDRVLIQCYGEYPVDVDNIGRIHYISEDEHGHQCGSLKTQWFQNFTSFPYVWIQFVDPKPNILIHVVCRLFAENVHFDKIESLGSTRFQLYVNTNI